ncbi:suppressor of fused domain protein [Streptomyces griseosporeus]|uniref:suppressor of fused domain protein n=1 Tax=Streptomyces griseosporeus TaxID=1910 RepID=UPI0036F93329
MIDHLEARLGPLGGAWSPEEGAPEGAPRVAYFTEGGLPGVHAFATIGLFKAPLTSRVSGRHQHMELLACGRAAPGDDPGPLPSVLEWVAGRLVTGGEAILRGEVIPLPMPLVPGGTMTALYATHPVYFDDDFASVVLENGVETIVARLVPIGASEAAYVREEGWPAFEDALARQDPDLLDLNRAEIALG